MALKSVYHHGKRVSKAHGTMLKGYEFQHGRLDINQGRRTLAEQAKFYSDWIRYRRVLAARPFPGAPHIKYGREHHALDINEGPARQVAKFYRSHGVDVAFNVPGEPWHMDALNEAQLKKAAAKLEAKDPVLKQGQTGKSVVALKKLLYDKGQRNFSGAKSSNRFIPFFSKYTKLSVQRFQRANGLPADGVVGPSTWKALRK